MLRALNLNPTLASIEKLGGTKKKNEKKLKVDEFLPIFSQVKKEKEQGNFDDFLECLKLYDKEENGSMMAAELSHTLLSLGKLYFMSLYILVLNFLLLKHGLYKWGNCMRVEIEIFFYGNSAQRRNDKMCRMQSFWQIFHFHNSILVYIKWNQLIRKNSKKY